MIGGYATAVGDVAGRFRIRKAITAPAVVPLDAPPPSVQRGLLLTFYEFTAADGDILRLVDVGDPAYGATLGEVDFDGNSWISTQINRGAIRESSTNFHSVPIQVADPTRSTRKYLNTHGVSGGSVVVRVIEFENLATPALAYSVAGRLQRWAPVDGPVSGVAVFTGSPASAPDATLPQLTYDRFRCTQVFEHRFAHTEPHRRCGAGSDNFTEQTRANYIGTAVAVEKEEDFGWWTVNADVPDRWQNGGSLGSAEYVILDVTATTGWDWDASGRDAPFLYQQFTDPALQDMDFDIVSSAVQTSFNDDDIDYGILVQSRASLDEWIYVGRRLRLLDATDQLVRVYRNDVGTVTTTTYAHTAGQIDDTESIAWRLRMVSGVFDFQWRIEDTLVDWDAMTTAELAWTTAALGLDLSSWWDDSAGLNIGLVCTLNNGGSHGVTGLRFQYFRLLKGGWNICGLSLSDCILRKNPHQFGGIVSLPDGTSIISI